MSAANGSPWWDAGTLARLRANWIRSQETAPETPDHRPLVRLAHPGGAAWLISEVAPEEGRAFGLCDLAMGFPELGFVDLRDLAEMGGVRRDPDWEPRGTISEYADAANAARPRRIVQLPA